MIKRLIFDVDGTLIRGVNFVASIERTLNRLNLYSKENVDLFLEGIKTYEQIYNNYNVIDYTLHMSRAINQSLPSNFVAIFFEELKSCIQPKDDLLIRTISELSQEYELVLLTNYFAESQLNRLNNMGIGKYFKECFGEHIIKPNRQAYLDACGDKLVSECVMIGDDIYLDIKRANEEGLKTIFVNSKGLEINSQMGIVVNSVEEISREIISQLDEKEDLN